MSLSEIKLGLPDPALFVLQDPPCRPGKDHSWRDVTNYAHTDLREELFCPNCGQTVKLSQQ